MTVTAEIDVTRPAGRRIVKDLESKRCVTLHHLNPGLNGTWHDLHSVIEKGFDKLSAHYGVDMRSLTSKYSKYYKA